MVSNVLIVKLKIPNSSKTQPPKASLVTLPRELLIMIMKRLDRASSASMGVASRIFYPLHRSIRGTASLRLRAWCAMTPGRLDGKRLHELLNDWMGGLEWEWYSRKYLGNEGLARIKEEEQNIEKEKGTRGLLYRQFPTRFLDAREKGFAMREAFGGCWIGATGFRCHQRNEGYGRMRRS
jgi:hypothetical protein